MKIIALFNGLNLKLTASFKADNLRPDEINKVVDLVTQHAHLFKSDSIISGFDFYNMIKADCGYTSSALTIVKDLIDRASPHYHFCCHVSYVDENGIAKHEVFSQTASSRAEFLEFVELEISCSRNKLYIKSLASTLIGSSSIATLEYDVTFLPSELAM